MFDKKSFIVMSIAAVAAAANDQCSWSPPKVDNGNNGNNNVSFDSCASNPAFCQKDDKKKEVIVSLCPTKPSVATEDTWWQIQDKIDDINEKIKTANEDKKATSKKCDEALTVWKSQYPYSCPSTQPNFEDYTKYLPQFGEETLLISAQAKRQESQSLKQEANTYTDKISKLENNVKSKQQVIDNVQAKIDKLDTFRIYWNSKGSDYDLVQEAWKTEIETLTQAQKTADEAYLTKNQKYIEENGKLSGLQQAQLDAQTAFASAIELELAVAKAALAKAETEAQDDIGTAKLNYDTEVNRLTKEVATAQSAYETQVAGLNIAGLEADYNTAYAAATQVAQDALDAQTLKIDGLNAQLQAAQNLLQQAQTAQSTIASLQTCVSTSEQLWTDAKASDSTDVDIYKNAFENAKGRLDTITAEAAEIIRRENDVKAVQQEIERSKLLLPGFRADLKEAEQQRDIPDSSVQVARKAWKDAEAKLTSDATITQLQKNLNEAISFLNNPQFGSEAVNLKNAYDQKVRDLTSGAKITKAKQDLQTKTNALSTSVTNYAELQNAVFTADSNYSKQKKVVDELKSQADNLQRTQSLAAEALGKFDQEQQKYFNGILEKQEICAKIDKDYPVDTKKALENFKSSWIQPGNPYLDQFASSLKVWLDAVEIANSVKVISIDEKAAFDAANQATLVKTLQDYTPQFMAQIIDYIDKLLINYNLFNDAKYEQKPDPNSTTGAFTWDVTYSNGVKANISQAIRQEQQNIVGQVQNLSIDNWTTKIKPEIIKALDKIIKDSLEKAKADQEAAQKNIDEARKKADENAIATATDAVKEFTDLLYGTSAQGEDPFAIEDLSKYVTDLICSNGQVLLCDGDLNFFECQNAAKQAKDAETKGADSAATTTDTGATTTDSAATTTDSAATTLNFVPATVGKIAEQASTLQQLNDAKALQNNFSDFIAYRTKTTNELTIQQKTYESIVAQLKQDWLTIEAPADLDTAVPNYDLCTPCDPCVDGATDTLTVKTAKSNMRKRQILAAKEKAKIDAMQLLIKNLSDEAWAKKQKETADAQVVDLQTKYETLTADVLENEQKESKAKQVLYAITSQASTEAEQNKWSQKYSAQITAAKASCGVAKAVEQSIRDEYQQIDAKIKALEKEEYEIGISKTKLKNAGCEDSIFLKERIKEYTAAEADKNFQKSVLKLDARIILGKDDFDFDKDWEDYIKGFEDKSTKLCKVVTDLENERDGYMNFDAKFKPKEIASLVCQDWCAIEDWNNFPSNSFFQPCISSVADLEREVQKVLQDITNDSVIDAFNQCAFTNLPKKETCLQWDNSYGSFSTEMNKAKCEFNKFKDEYNYYVNQDPDGLKARAAQLLIDAEKDENRSNEWKNDVKAQYAVAIRDCQKDNPVSDVDSKIIDWNAQIANLIIQQSRQYESYWQELEAKKDAEIADLDKKLADAENALKADNQEIFKIIVPSSTRTIARRMLKGQERQLLQVTRQDLSMIDSLAVEDKPKKIKICSGQLTSGTDAIVGFQMYYGSGSIEVAGPAHGDVSQGCTDYNFNGKTATDVNFYTDPSSILQGIEIKFGDPAVTFVQPIKAGLTSTSGQLVYETSYDTDADFQFFGFDTKFEDTTLQFEVPGIATYNPTEYTAVKTTILETPALVAQAKSEKEASKLAVKEWEQVVIYQKVIEADVTTGIEMVKPGNTYVLRKSEAIVLQAAIDEQVENIKKEQAAYNEAWQQAIDAKLGGADPMLINHEKTEEPENAGAIVATIIGCLMLFAAIALVIFRKRMANKYQQMSMARGRGGVKTATLVNNNSSFRSDSQAARPDDI